MVTEDRIFLLRSWLLIDLQKLVITFHIYYNALGVSHRRTFLALGISRWRIYLPSAFRTTALSLPSAFRTEGLLCLRLFTRQDFPCPRHFAPTDFSAFGFSHDRTFLALGISRRRTSLPSVFARQDFPPSAFRHSAIQCKVMQRVAIWALMNAIAMSKDWRVGLIIKWQPSGESPFYLMEIPQVNCNQAVPKAE